MSALRWVSGPFGCDDLIDAGHRIRGYVMPIGSSVRGYVIRRRSHGLAAMDRMEDFPSAKDARAFVEAMAERGERPTEATNQAGAA